VVFSVRELIWAEKVIKRELCLLQSECHQVADKYIEYDPVIVMIDLVLLNEQAYRHVLYNSPFKVSWNYILWNKQGLVSQ
jgi:hypothetical protein